MVLQNERQLNRLNRLVEDLLDLARLDSGKLTISPEPVNLASMVGDVVSRFDMARHQVSIKADRDVEVFCDRFRIEQVVMNLLTNAIKYGADKPIEIRIKSDSQGTELEVEDSGLGIASKDQERIFRRFERAVSEKNISGFGLGLYITKQIVDSHGGELTLKSEVGRGSVFRVRFPQYAELGSARVG